MELPTPCKTFEEYMEKHYGLSVSVSANSEDWPRIVFELDNNQYSKLKRYGFNNLEKLIIASEMVANHIHQPNAGILGTTKCTVEGSKLIIKGSLTVVELMIKKIFN